MQYRNVKQALGQILRVRPALHILFNIESEDDIPDIASNSAIEAAINFVETCCQHTAYICGHGVIAEEMSASGSGKNRRIKSLKIRYIIATNRATKVSHD